ncbi:MAG: PEPxxWA-CTERM sorting domain-containing protein [Caulobacteraceae bacterium]
MKIRTYLAASAAVASLAAFGLAAPAQAADNISLNTWYAGQFLGTPSPLAGGGSPGTNGPVLPSGFATGLSAPTAPWTITLTGSGTLTVTDVEDSGDHFQMFDNGDAMTAAASPFTALGQNPGQTALPAGYTSAPTPGDLVGADINDALGNADFSSGTFALSPGVNNITGEFVGRVGDGSMDFIAEASAVPEPATWALMLAGFAGLGFALRLGRRTAALTV